jgi:hypothetical protein
LRNTYKTIGVGANLVFALIFASRFVFAFPNQEKATLSVASTQATSFIAQNDRFLFLGFSNTVLRLDTETFALSDDQVPLLTGDATAASDPDLGGDVEGMAIQGSNLFISQDDGDLLIVDLDNVTSTPTARHVLDGALGPIAVNPRPTIASNTVYLLNTGGSAILIFDTASKTSTSISLTDSVAAPVTPEAIAFVPGTPSTSPGKFYITSARGLIFVLPEGATSLSSTITIATSNKDLTSAAPTPDGNFLLVTDNTDDVVHVIDTSTDTEVDTDPVAANVNPIDLTQYSDLSGILVTDVTNPDDTYAYVSVSLGSSVGLAVIDLNIGLAGFNPPSLIDFDTGSSVVQDDPLALSSKPKALVASSAADGYVYSDNGDAKVSVITENPFVSISGTSLGGGSLSTDGTFSITFQTDETGSFRVVVGGDSTGNGSEVASGTVDAALTDVATPDIAFDSSLFAEGSNRVFVFVTDSSGRVGRDAVDIEVNTPPPGIEVLSTDFGDQKIFVTFARLTASDIDHYNLYVDTDSSAVATKTDIAGTASQPSSGDVKVKIVGLDNGVTYFVGIEAVDTSGNVGARTTTFPDGTPISATPEQTLGLAEAVGESGCELVRGRVSTRGGECVFLLFLGALSLATLKKNKWMFGLLCLSVLIFQPAALGAKELTPQWFSLEFKGGVWFPTDHTTKTSLGTLEPTGSVEFSFLYHSRYAAELGVGVVPGGGKAFGATSGDPSGDHFGLLLIPIENSFAFRADFREDQLLVPYVKAGPDYVFFHETLNGDSTSGFKFGLHGAVGLQILLDRIDPLSNYFERDVGVNDVYFTIEGRYAWVNNFGSGGLDLSNLTATGGFLFEF